ncbi:MAG: DUF1800 domain-containing protein [Litoricolaceae bacterium]|nr:DUF1800 domain-containing protein [Litorivicinaceae bacterium]
MRVASFLGFIVLILTGGCRTVTENNNPNSASVAFAVAELSVDSMHLSIEVSLEDAIHLENRAGIGAPKYRVEKLIGLSRAEAIDLTLRDLKVGSARSYRLPPWVDQGSFVFLEGRYNSCNISQVRRVSSLENRWIEEILLTDAPAYERLVLLFSNHFVADFNSYRAAEAYARHHKIIRDNSAGNMANFLDAILKDPAIIIYLNNNTNFISNVNENLAREYLELFTLGEGHYTERDIKNLAKVFAGESVNPISQEYEWLRAGSSPRSFNVLGKEIRKPNDVTPLVLGQEAHALYLAEIFYREYVNFEQIDPVAVQQIASRYYRSGFEIQELLRATLETPNFWAENNRYSLIKDPVDLVLGTARTIGMSNDMALDFRDISGAFSRINFFLINPPNVAGYPGGFAWIDGGLLEKRIGLLRSMFVNSKNTVDMPKYREARSSWLREGESRRIRYNNELGKILSEATPDQLIVEAAFLHYANRSFKKNNHPGFKLSLLGVHLGDKKWEGITYQMGRDKKNGYDFVRLESNDCFPSCLKSFNGGFSKKYGVEVIKYDPFNPAADNRNVQSTLSSDERLLMKRLAQLVHFLPTPAVAGSGRFGAGGPENRQAWLDWLQKRQQSSDFKSLRDASGIDVEPVVIVNDAAALPNLCKAKYDNALDQYWLRLRRDVPSGLSNEIAKGWIALVLPESYKLVEGGEAERVLLTEAFQLK